MPIAVAAIILVGLAPAPPASAASTTKAQQIIAVAKAHIGDPYRFGAAGPTAFDCSGLVIYAYTKAGYGNVIRAGDPRYRSAAAMYQLFKSQGKASRTYPRLGDLVVWGDGKHIGIYVGSGNAISTLTRGVTVHKVSAFYLPLTAYLHTGMDTPIVAPPAPARYFGSVTVSR
jgi:cell wall-associated NlpC family hydrolase